MNYTTIGSMEWNWSVKSFVNICEFIYTLCILKCKLQIVQFWYSFDFKLYQVILVLPEHNLQFFAIFLPFFAIFFISSLEMICIAKQGS